VASPHRRESRARSPDRGPLALEGEALLAPPIAAARAPGWLSWSDDDVEQALGVGYALESLFASIRELDTGAGDEILDRGGHEHLVCFR